MNVTISLRSAEILKTWLGDLNKALHMIPKSTEYNAFLELCGAIEDSHYDEKKSTILSRQTGRLNESAQIDEDEDGFHRG